MPDVVLALVVALEVLELVVAPPAPVLVLAVLVVPALDVDVSPVLVVEPPVPVPVMLLELQAAKEPRRSGRTKKRVCTCPRYHEGRAESSAERSRDRARSVCGRRAT